MYAQPVGYNGFMQHLKHLKHHTDLAEACTHKGDI